MKKISIFMAVCSLFVGLTATTYAAEFIAPSNDDNSKVKTSSTEVHRNLYTAGGSVTISGETKGDLYAAGGTLTIEGPVEQDVVVAGGTVNILGNVGGDVRVFAGTVIISGTVGGDLLGFGGTITTSEKSTIAGDVVVGSGDITIDGPVGGMLMASGGTVSINNKVAGTVKIQCSEQLTFGSKAEVAGAITYYGKKEAIVKDGAKVSSIDYKPYKDGRKDGATRKGMAGLIGFGFAIKLLAWIISGMLLIGLFKTKTQSVVDLINKEPGKNLGIGFLVLIVGPIGGLLVLITLVGYYVALLSFLAYLLFFGLSALLASIFIGAWLVKVLTKRPSLSADWQAVLVGVAIMAILALIPVFGWLIVAVLSIIALGALVRVLRSALMN
jgi:hypothetical protein